MIEQKYQSLVFSFFMALLMSGIMSFVISLFNLGFIENIFFIWLKAWGFAFVVAFPVILIVTPVVKVLVAFFIKIDE
ncbi:MAG: DUF2798 domain-containing protein [Colwellia sp.]|nr:DUF2798 domain-containing protein [Colwellia sp.]